MSRSRGPGPMARVGGDVAPLIRFGSLSLALLMIQVDNFALVVALPSMAEDLGVATTDASWAIGAYMVAFGVALIPGGRLGDVVGRKRTMLVALGAFVLASVAAGLADSIAELVWWRIVQGVAGGVYSPLTLSLVSATVGPDRRGRVLGTVMAAAAVGTAAGPIAGGVLTASVGWRWALLVNLPIGLVAIIWGAVRLPESRDSEAAERGLRGVDWAGTALAVIGVAALSFGLEAAAARGLSPMTFLLVVAGGSAVLLLAAWEKRARWPLLPPRLWRQADFRFLVATCALVYMALMVAFFVATVDAQDVRGLSPLAVGLLFVPPALGRMVASLTAGRLASRSAGLAIMPWSVLAGAVTLAVLAVAEPLWLFVAALTASALALGVGHQFGVVDVQIRVPNADAGAAAGLMLTILMLAGGLAVAVTATVVEVASGGTPDASGVMWTILGWSGALALGGVASAGWVRRLG